ncbi:MAG TPA: hypothetical protein VI612_02790 [Candidatus Nanoarchaeia archaeon]|nr:hypothetical protein [Candidatus Nanoarchaeia archaeon]
MESINQKVWHALETDPAIKKDLIRRLINTRALAKYLIQSYGINASLDAVISSIRRFPLGRSTENEKSLQNIFRDSIISTKNNIACVTISHPPSETLSRLATISIPTIRVTTGTDEVKVMVENKNAEKIAKLFKNADVRNHLSEISVTVSERAVTTKGVLARIAGELAVANINIHELLVCPPQFLIYVSQDDIVKAHERILALSG